MIISSVNEHFVGINFRRSVKEVHEAMTVYRSSVEATIAARVAKISKLLDETKSVGSDADAVIAWVGKNTQWSQAPLRPQMVEMLTEAHFASLERGLLKQLSHLVGWLAVDLKADPARVLELAQSDMTIFLPYDSESLRSVAPYYGGLPADIGVSRFGGPYDTFGALVSSTTGG